MVGDGPAVTVEGVGLDQPGRDDGAEIEAVVLTAIGGLAGLAIGEVASLLMNRYSPLPAYVPLWAIGVGIGVSAAVGIVFGLWPAWKAARLNPIEALRWE